MTHYVDHNCSITVHVRANEWEGVEQWVWDNWDDIVAVSFLSLEDSFYDLLPYESITKDEYLELNKKMRPFVPSLISKYEFEESREEVIDTECSSGACPVR
jgi:ribonucleoside-diphosphate reductase alpha chain/ribonucleoside-triphosphate reductase